MTHAEVTMAQGTGSGGGRRFVAMLLALLLIAAACGGGGGESSTADADEPTATAVEAALESDPDPTPEPADEPEPDEAPPTPTEAPEPTPTEVPPTSTPEPTPTPEPRFPENTGEGVTVVIFDRGIDYDHPDFVNPDGTTRIEAILDMTGQENWCQGSTDSVEYTRDEINAALASGEPLGTDDYNGHGTATAGMAAGSGLAVDGAPYRGVATGADLLIIKISSEGAPASGYGPGETAIAGCFPDALAWADRKMTELDQPAVALWNVGAQWGPIDGTSAKSRDIEAVFGPDRPGRVWVVSSGDDGSVANHAGGSYAPGEPLEIRFDKQAGRPSFPTAWLSGDAPATVTIEFDSGATIGPVAPGQFPTASGMTIQYFTPGNEFYPWQSTSGDYGIWMSIDDSSAGPGVIRFESLGGEGHVDLYGDLLGEGHLETSMPFQDNLLPGRLSDLSATNGAIVVGVHVERDFFESVEGGYEISSEGRTGELWLKSSDGRTRDGRAVLDVTAAGQNAPASLAQNSYWASLRGNVLADSGGYYVRFGGTSAAGPIVVGTVALMLEVNPDLTAAEVKEILRATAVADEFTGEVPNDQWGHGKLDIIAAVQAAAG